MPLTLQRTLVVMSCLCAITAPCAQAQAQERSKQLASGRVAECARSYEEAQEQQKSGQLLSARALLRDCAQDDCPEFIRNDCSAWSAKLQSKLPSVVFVVRSRGQELSDVRVIIEGRELSSRIDGRALELDPGRYDFEFQAEGMQPLRLHSVIVNGERNRLIQAELEPLVSKPRLEQPATLHELPAIERAHPPVVREAQSSVRAAPSLFLPGIFAGATVVGVAGFIGFGSWGRASENRLAGSCSPDCNGESIASVRAKYVAADISLGFGVASLALGTFFFLHQGSDSQAPTRPPQIALMLRPGAATFSYSGELR